MRPICEFEFLILLLVFPLCFYYGRNKTSNKNGGVDLATSNAIKGMACVFILMGHYETILYNITGNKPVGFSNLIWHTTANIALVLFMYFSGYGLSLKREHENLLPILLKRLGKVYIPLMYMSVITIIVYTLMPENGSLEDLTKICASDLWYVHHINKDVLYEVLLPRLFGWPDWYVFCIMIFYLLFYLSLMISHKVMIPQTYFLWIFMCLYFIIAYVYLGPQEAHWYHFCWVFFGGHLHALWGELATLQRKTYSILFVLLTSTILIESKWMILSYLIGILTIAAFTHICNKYTVNSKLLAFLGSISYFFYLSHIRIGYQLMTYMNINSVILWVLLTCFISWMLKIMYKKLCGF